MATVDFTLDDLQDGVREIVRQELSSLQSETTDLRAGVKDGFIKVNDKLDAVKTMLTEDYIAEADRLTRTNKRLLKLRRQFDAHLTQGHVSSSL